MSLIPFDLLQVSSIQCEGSITFLCKSFVMVLLVGAIFLGMNIRLVFGELNDLSI